MLLLTTWEHIRNICLLATTRRFILGNFKLTTFSLERIQSLIEIENRRESLNLSGRVPTLLLLLVALVLINFLHLRRTTPRSHQHTTSKQVLCLMLSLLKAYTYFMVLKKSKKSYMILKKSFKKIENVLKNDHLNENLVICVLIYHNKKIKYLKNTKKY